MLSCQRVLGRHVCRANALSAPKCSRHVLAFIVWVQENPEIPAKFPASSPRKMPRKIHRRASAGKQGEDSTEFRRRPSNKHCKTRGFGHRVLGTPSGDVPGTAGRTNCLGSSGRCPRDILAVLEKLTIPKRLQLVQGLSAKSYLFLTGLSNESERDMCNTNYHYTQK